MAVLCDRLSLCTAVRGSRWSAHRGKKGGTAAGAGLAGVVAQLPCSRFVALKKGRAAIAVIELPNQAVLNSVSTLQTPVQGKNRDAA